MPHPHPEPPALLLANNAITATLCVLVGVFAWNEIGGRDIPSPNAPFLVRVFALLIVVLAAQLAGTFLAGPGAAALAGVIAFFAGIVSVVALVTLVQRPFVEAFPRLLLATGVAAHAATTALLNPPRRPVRSPPARPLYHLRLRPPSHPRPLPRVRHPRHRAAQYSPKGIAAARSPGFSRS